MNAHVLTCCCRYLLALVAGIGLSFAYAPYNMGVLAWSFPAVLVALIWSVPRSDAGWKRDWGRGFRVAFVAGFGFWVRDVAFVGAASEQGGWVSSSLMALYLAVYFALYGGWAATLGRWPAVLRRQPAFQILGLAALHGGVWCGLEWVRGLGRVSFGWDGLGVSFVESAFAMAQSADVVGVTGLSFLIVFGGVVLVQTGRAFHHKAVHGTRRVHWEVVVTLSVLCLNFLYGIHRLREVRQVETVAVPTLLVQQNIPIAESWNEGNFALFRDAVAAAYDTIEMRATETLLETGRAEVTLPELVLFPETGLPSALWVDEQGEPYPYQWLQTFIDEELAQIGEFYLIAGLVEYPTRFTEEGVSEMIQEGPFYNTVSFFPEGFASYQMRAKQHLMPFGEYMPLGDFPLFQQAYQYSAGMTFGEDFTPGTDYTPVAGTLQGVELSFIPTVCYEDTVSRVVRRYVRHESQVIVNVTNDGWFAGTACAEKHFQNARYRAIEFRRPLVRAANTGVSGVVGLTGSTLHPITQEPQILTDTQGNTEVAGSLEALVEVPTAPVLTVYSVIGDVCSWGGGLVALCCSLVMWLRREQP